MNFKKLQLSDFFEEKGMQNAFKKTLKLAQKNGHNWFVFGYGIATSYHRTLESAERHRKHCADIGVTVHHVDDIEL